MCWPPKRLRHPAQNACPSAPTNSERVVTIPVVILCMRRAGMPKQFIAQLQSTGYGHHHVDTLECLGLVDKETIRNLTRTFGDADKVLDVSCCACFPKGCVLG